MILRGVVHKQHPLAGPSLLGKDMGGALAALFNLGIGGQHAPHVNSRCDCKCSNSSSSSEEEAKQRETTTWLQRHRPGPEEPRTARPAASKHHKGTQTEWHDHKR